MLAVWTFLMCIRTKKKLKELAPGDKVIFYIDNDRTAGRVISVDDMERVAEVQYFGVYRKGGAPVETTEVDFKDLMFPLV